MEHKVLFEEKQYIGYNRWSLLWRTTLALSCFVLYYWSENPKPVDVALVEIPSSPVGENSGQLFFLMGIILMIYSLALIFVLHLHTKITDKDLTLGGLWTSRKVKISLENIIEAKKVNYSRYMLNPPVYNLHYKNQIRFFTQGNDALELTNKDGITYRIGSLKPDEFLKTIIAAAPHLK